MNPPSKVFLLMMLLIVVEVYCLESTPTGRENVRLIYVYEKAAVLILWRCGDVEQNPGPPSDTMRSVEKVIISLLVGGLQRRTRNIKSKQADYKSIPEGWNTDIWFGDPSTGNNEKRRAMLQGLLCMCQTRRIDIPYKLQTVLKKYQTIIDKQDSETEREQNFKDLENWLKERRFYNSVDQTFEEYFGLPKHSQKSAVAYLVGKLRANPDVWTKVCETFPADEKTFDCADQDGTTVQQTESQTETGSTPSLCSLKSASSYTMVADSPRNSLTVPDPSIAIPFQKPDIVQDKFGNDLPQIRKRKSEQMTNADLKSLSAKRQRLAETSRHDEQPPTPVASSSELPLQEVVSTALDCLDSFDDLKDGDYDVNSLQETSINLEQFVVDCLKDQGLIAQIYDWLTFESALK